MPDPLAQIVGLLRPGLSYSKYLEGAGAWRVRRTEHGRPFFCAVLDGAIRLGAQDHEPLIVQRGDLVLIPAAHDFIASSITETTGHIDSMPTELRPNVFWLGDARLEPQVRMVVGYCVFGSTDAELLVSLLPALIHVQGDNRLASLVQLAADEFTQDRPARDAVLPRLMELLFIEALRASVQDCPRGIIKGLGDNRLAPAIRGIHDRPEKPWTIAQLASVSALSRSAFFDRFRQAMGVAPMEYLLHWRMALAKDLLRDRKLSVAEIADCVGYGSASSFSVAFTRHVGATPSLYRCKAHA